MATYERVYLEFPVLEVWSFDGREIRQELPSQFKNRNQREHLEQDECFETSKHTPSDTPLPTWPHFCILLKQFYQLGLKYLTHESMGDIFLETITCYLPPGLHTLVTIL